MHRDWSCATSSNLLCWTMFLTCPECQGSANLFVLGGGTLGCAVVFDCLDLRMPTYIWKRALGALDTQVNVNLTFLCLKNVGLWVNASSAWGLFTPYSRGWAVSGVHRSVRRLPVSHWNEMECDPAATSNPHRRDCGLPSPSCLINSIVTEAAQQGVCSLRLKIF